MATRICQALDDPDELPEMGRRGRLRVQEKFGFVTQAELYRQLFEELCPGAASRETPILTTQTDETPVPPAMSLNDDLLAMESTCNN